MKQITSVLSLLLLVLVLAGCATTQHASPQPGDTRLGSIDRIRLLHERLKMTLSPKFDTECMVRRKDARPYCEVHLRSIDDPDACPALFQGNFDAQGKWTECVHVTRDGQPYCAEHDLWDCPSLTQHEHYDAKCIVVDRDGQPYCAEHDSYKCNVLLRRQTEASMASADAPSRDPQLYCEEHNDHCGILLPHKGSTEGKHLQIVGTAPGKGLLSRQYHTAYAYIK